MVQMMTQQLLLGMWVVQLVDGACTCPPAAASCSLQDLVSSTGQDDCTVGADGVLAASISIRDFSQLAAIDFSGLVRTSGELRVTGCPELTEVLLPSLEVVGGVLFFESCRAMVSLSLPSLATVGAWTGVQVMNLVSLELPALRSTTNLYLDQLNSLAYLVR